jgi:proteasome lid subunit RPN8/RPN11
MLTLSKKTEQAIRAEGERVYPNECCGVLLGETAEDGGRSVADILPVDNRRESEEQYHRFVITAEDFMRAEAAAAKRGLDVVGVYHSHPDHPAAPSDYDRTHALPFYSYIIVAVEKGSAGAFTSWELSPDRETFLQEEIVWQ